MWMSSWSQQQSLRDPSGTNETPTIVQVPGKYTTDLTGGPIPSNNILYQY